MDGSNAAQEAELDAVARQPRPWHAGATQADEMWDSPSHCLWRDWSDSDRPAACGSHLLRPKLACNDCDVSEQRQAEAKTSLVLHPGSPCAVDLPSAS